MLPALFALLGALAVPSAAALATDAIEQDGVLKASDAANLAQFGDAVAIDGDYAVVGSHRANASGGAGGVAAGKAYVFRFDGTSWTQQAVLAAPDTDSDDYFGIDVDIDGNTVVVGCPREDSAVSGTGNNPSTDNGSPNSGAVFVYERVGIAWPLADYIKAEKNGPFDRFGFSVALDGDRLVVGAPDEDSADTGVDGDPTDDSMSDSGAAFTYVRDTTGWKFESYLKASNTGAQDRFGSEVAIHGDTIAVGAPAEDGAATGVNGSGASNGANDSGAVYVFVHDGSNWSQQAYVKATNTGSLDLFGSALALEDDLLVVGAPQERSDASTNGDQTDNGSFAAGAAYALVRTGSSWSHQAYLKHPAADGNDRFGTSVATSGPAIAVGAPGDDSGWAGAGGDPNDDSIGGSGAVVLFDPAGFSWQPVEFLKYSHPDSNDAFGTAVALEGERLLVGAPQEDGTAAGSPSSDSLPESGAVAAFDLGYLTPIPGCFANAAGIVEPQAPIRIGTTFEIKVVGAGVQNGVVAVYYGALGVNGAGCGVQLGVGAEALLALTPLPTLVGVGPLNGGVGGQPLPIPNDPGLVGIRVTVQALLVDTLTFASEVSQGLEVELRP